MNKFSKCFFNDSSNFFLIISLSNNKDNNINIINAIQYNLIFFFCVQTNLTFKEGKTIIFFFYNKRTKNKIHKKKYKRNKQIKVVQFNN